MPARPILIVEDEHALGAALEMLIRRMGHLPTLTASAGGAARALESKRFAAVVLDIGLPDESGLAVLDKMRQGGDITPVLVITAHATLEHAIHAQKSGATGYLTKPIDMRELERSLAALLDPGIRPNGPASDFGERRETRCATMIGAAPCLRDAFTGIARACAGDLPVLITGPSGAGKSLAASVIHANGARCHEPLAFIHAADINDCCDLPDGTVVLEEISDLPAAAQADLARQLAVPGIRRTRVMATTAGDHRAAASDGRIRTDLYYELATLTIPLPPLRERSGDIPALAAFLTGLHGGGRAPDLTPPVVAALQIYSWPGNVRELKHVLDYAMSVSGGGPVFLSHLPAHVAAACADPGAAPGELNTVIGRWLDHALGSETPPAYDDLLDKMEGVVLHHLMARFDQKPTHLASALRIHRATLRQKLRRAGLRRDGD